MKRIGILGAGTWGMALARMLTVSGNDVLVWSAIEKEIDDLSTTRVHPNLPQMKIPEELRFTKSIEEVCKDKDILLFAVPSVFVRSTAAKARPYVADGQIIVDVAKGIEPDTLYTMTEILADELGREGGPKNIRLVALSGPTHAEEVAIDLPTTIVSASKDAEAAAFVQEVFTNNVMRVYTNDDIKGVELSGAMKNVIALGVGISTGLGYGDNARAALITRGIAETDPQLLELARAYGFGRGRTLRRIYIPSVLPYFASGCRTALGLAWKAGVAAEVLCQPQNAIGTQIYNTKYYLETTSLFAWTLVVIALSFLLEWAVGGLLRRAEGPEGGRRP